MATGIPCRVFRFLYCQPPSWPFPIYLLPKRTQVPESLCADPNVANCQTWPTDNHKALGMNKPVLKVCCGAFLAPLASGRRCSLPCPVSLPLPPSFYLLRPLSPVTPLGRRAAQKLNNANGGIFYNMPDGAYSSTCKANHTTNVNLACDQSVRGKLSLNFVSQKDCVTVFKVCSLCGRCCLGWGWGR